MTIFALQTSGKYSGHEWLGLAYIASNIKDDDTVVMFDTRLGAEFKGDDFLENIDRYRRYGMGGSSFQPFVDWYMNRLERCGHEDVVFISNGWFNEFQGFENLDEWAINNMVTLGKYSWFNPLLD